MTAMDKTSLIWCGPTHPPVRGADGVLRHSLYVWAFKDGSVQVSAGNLGERCDPTEDERVDALAAAVRGLAKAVAEERIVVPFAREHTSCQLTAVASSEAGAAQRLIRLGTGGIIDPHSLSPAEGLFAGFEVQDVVRAADRRGEAARWLLSDARSHVPTPLAFSSKRPTTEERAACAAVAFDIAAGFTEIPRIDARAWMACAEFMIFDQCGTPGEHVARW